MPRPFSPDDPATKFRPPPSTKPTMAKKEQHPAATPSATEKSAVPPASAPASTANHVTNNNGSATPSSSSSHEVNAAHDALSASANDYFAPGSVVRCVLFNDSVVEGEVMAFDPATKMIIIKGPATNKRSSHNNVSIVNLSMSKDMTVLSEAKEAKPADPPSLNLTRLNARANVNIEKKKRIAKAFKAGISPEGQRLFQAICKTLEDTDWSGENIVVMGKVTITPPYRVENVKGVSEKATIHVKKIVEKHIEDIAFKKPN